MCWGFGVCWIWNKDEGERRIEVNMEASAWEAGLVLVVQQGTQWEDRIWVLGLLGLVILSNW